MQLRPGNNTTTNALNLTTSLRSVHLSVRQSYPAASMAQHRPNTTDHNHSQSAETFSATEPFGEQQKQACSGWQQGIIFIMAPASRATQHPDARTASPHSGTPGCATSEPNLLGRGCHGAGGPTHRFAVTWPLSRSTRNVSNRRRPRHNNAW